MKFLPSQLAYLTTDREARANLRALGRYLLFLALLVAGYAVLFHVIKLYVEGQQHSWITGLYWTLVVMSTLGTRAGQLFGNRVCVAREPCRRRHEQRATFSEIFRQ